MACLFPLIAQAKCEGVNLYDELAPQAQSDIQAMLSETPYASGNFWRAKKGDETITVIGTYHLDDTRHLPVVEATRGLIASADALLVEAGPIEHRALKSAIAKDPSLMMITDGPTLIERLPPETWQKLSQAFERRGVPSFLAAKFQPWYVAILFALPPCSLQGNAEPKGLDGALIELAETFDTKIIALEPYTTVFDIFNGLTPEQELSMIESTLVLEARAEDYAATLASLYFAGEARMIWELNRQLSYGIEGYTRAEIDAEVAMLEERLMTKRNTAWIPVIEEAAAAHEAPLVVAFGALHLSGEHGVLNLLEQAGWQIERIEF